MKENLSNETRALLPLIMRSERDAEGWANVSNQLWPSVQKWAHPRLTETKSTAEGNFIRLTSEGKTVLDFL